MVDKKKILYIGEVPIEPLPGGALLIYRIFDLVGIIPFKIYFNNQANLDSEILYCNYAFKRLGYSRVSKIYGFLNFYFLWVFPYLKLKNKCLGYDKIVAISHGVSYKIAYKLSKKYKIPLISVHHDIYENTFPTLGKNSIREWFFKSAKDSTNLYVSEYMKEVIGIEGLVLLPFRDKEDDYELGNKEGVKKEKVIVYAGSAHSQTYVPIIANVANAINKIGWRLRLYSNLTQNDFVTALETVPTNLEIQGFIPNTVLKKVIINTASSMLLIQSFEPEHRLGQATNFPSKLTDYTLGAVPIIFIGPEYASGIRWFNSLSSSIGLWIDNGDMSIIQSKLVPFLENEKELNEKGFNAKDVGNSYFSASNYKEILTKLFYD
jgi:hypothetical protein